MGFSHIKVASTTHSILKAASLKPVPTVGTVRKTYIPKRGEGGRVSNYPDPAQGSTREYILLMTSSNISILTYC